MIFVNLILVVAMVNATPQEPFQELTRVEFAAKMAELKKGVSKYQVENILGSAEKVLKIESENRHQLPEGIQYFGVTEVWYYGTNEVDDFPTLGQVHFDSNGNIIVTHGGKGIPINSERINETAIREYLRLVHSMPGATGHKWNPLDVIKVVNALFELGKDDGLAVVQEYLRISPRLLEVHEQVGLLLRVLHEVPEETGYFPELNLGANNWQPRDPKLVPRFPVHILDEIPVLMVSGYQYSGDIPTNTLEILDWYRVNGVWRKTRLNIPSLSERELEKLELQAIDLSGQYLDSSPAKLTTNMIYSQLERLKKTTKDDN